VFERDLRRQFQNAPCGHDNEFSITAVAILADHLNGSAELLPVQPAIMALTASREVMDANPITAGEI